MVIFGTKTIICPVCSNEFDGKDGEKIIDGKICSKCASLTGYKSFRDKTLQQISNTISYVKNVNEIYEEFSKNVSTKIKNYIAFNEKDQTWAILNNTYPIVYNYSDIVGVDLILDGDTSTKWVISKHGLFSNTVTQKTKNIINKMQIEVELNNSEKPYEYITVVNYSVKVEDELFRAVQDITQEILGMLYFILQENEKKQEQQQVGTNTVINPTNADEILKYKSLLDIGAITQEEFEQKKKQLLELNKDNSIAIDPQIDNSKYIN